MNSSMRAAKLQLNQLALIDLDRGYALSYDIVIQIRQYILFHVFFFSISIVPYYSDNSYPQEFYIRMIPIR